MIITGPFHIIEVLKGTLTGNYKHDKKLLEKAGWECNEVNYDHAYHVYSQQITTKTKRHK